MEPSSVSHPPITIPLLFSPKSIHLEALNTHLSLTLSFHLLPLKPLPQKNTYRTTIRSSFVTPFVWRYFSQYYGENMIKGEKLALEWKKFSLKEFGITTSMIAKSTRIVLNGLKRKGSSTFDFQELLACPVYAVWVIVRSTWCPKRMRKRTTLMKFMKEIAYDGVEILQNDNVEKGVEEYSAADMDGIREDW
ncbi:hypothetical protein Hanom_Chr11g01007261 [Helianthus anomalus]